MTAPHANHEVAMSSTTQHPPDSITLALGSVEVPLDLVTALVKRHLLRALRVSSNGLSPSPPLAPQEEPAPAVPPLESPPPVPADAGAP